MPELSYYVKETFGDKAEVFPFDWAMKVMDYVQEPYNYTKGNFIKTESALMNIGNLRLLYTWGE